MSFDERLRHSLDSLVDELRDETRRRLASLSDELNDTVETERAAAAAQAAAEARRDVDQEIAARVAAAVAAAESGMLQAIAAAELRGAESGRDAGRAEGRAAGLGEGRAAGMEEGRLAGIATGRQDGLEEGRRTGLESGRQQGRLEGKDEGRKEGREAGIEEGRRAGRETGRDEGRKEGRAAGLDEGKREGTEEGRKAGREEGFDKGLAQGRAEGEQAGREAAVAEDRSRASDAALADHKAAELAASERLIEAVRAIDRAKSLTEILDTLVSSAGQEARRAAVLLVRNGQLRGWRFIGFGQPLDEKNDVAVPSDAAGVVAEAARTGAAVSADSGAGHASPAFARLPPGREVLAVPVSMSGQIVAVLYADQGPDDPGSLGSQSPRLAWPSIVELLARHAARCLEAITAFRAAQVLTERPDVPAPVARGPQTAGREGNDTNDREDPKEAALRYARLLVSEIKLYHEAAVVAGRKERDLMTRLAGEVARARVLYEQRVPAGVRRAHDYFHDELVKTLAGGDARLIEVNS